MNLQSKFSKWVREQNPSIVGLANYIGTTDHYVRNFLKDSTGTSSHRAISLTYCDKIAEYYDRELWEILKEIGEND